MIGPVVGELVAQVSVYVKAGKRPEAIWLDRDLWLAYVEQAGVSWLPIYDAREGRLIHVPVDPMGAAQ